MRNVLLALGAVLALALSGCSGGGSDAPSQPTGSATMTSTGPPPEPPVLSDTLHLLAPPEMALVLPEGSQESETGTASFNGPGGGGEDEPAAQWAYKVAGNSSVTSAEIHVWIEITDTLVQPVNPFQGQSCTWVARLELGADGEPHTGCIAEPPGPINPGTKELVFQLVGLDAELEANETIVFTFRRAAFSASPEDSVMVLSGSAEHDSRLVLKGLKEVVQD